MNSLKFYRLKKGLTMKELADMVGIPQSSYSYIEKGDITANEEVVQKICNVLKIPREGIFYPAKFRIRELDEVNLIV